MPDAVTAPAAPTGSTVTPVAPSAPTAPAAPAPAAQPSANPWDAAKASVVEQSVAVEPGQGGPSWKFQPRASDGKWTADDPDPGDGTADDMDDTTGATDEVASGASGTEDGADPAAETAAEGDETQPETITVSIPPIREGGEPIDVDTDDPETADAIRHLINNGMRRADFARKMEAVERREGQVRDFEARLQYVPETIIEAMPPEARTRTINYLLATHFDELRPTIEAWWTDDVARRGALVDHRETAQQQTRQYQAAIEAKRQEAEILRGVETLIPPTASPDDEQDFLRDAVSDLVALANAGTPITVQSLPTLLARRLARYGWTAGASADASPAAPARTQAPAVTARPQGDVAAQMADVKRQQQRRVQTQRERAQARQIAPAGAGAQAATLPKPPTDSWESVRSYVKQNFANRPIALR